MRRFAWILAFFFVGCAGAATGEHAEVARLAQFADDFRSAVDGGDADAIYEMLGDDAKSFYSIGEFRSFFVHHKMLFADYGRRLQASLQAGARDIRAQYGANPCGRGELEASGTGWVWTDLPDGETFDDAAGQKSRLAALMQTQAFSRALKSYADAHPEQPKDGLRRLRRALMFGGVGAEDIVFDGDHARIEVGGVAKIDMVCAQNGWRIDGCFLYRSTK